MTNISKQKIKQLAQASGFDLSGIAPAEPLTEAINRLDQWLEKKYHGTMQYMQRNRHIRANPKELFPQAKSILMLGTNYLTTEPQKTDPNKEWIISRYAFGRDYHKVCKKLAKQLIQKIETEFQIKIQSRICVDSAPILERAYAARAGLGWIGKNTCLIHPKLGSYFFLTAILWDLELEPDHPIKDFCGKCTACLENCPTNAFLGPKILDATKCISYHTIELREEIPQQFHKQIGNQIFGCDICQEVCPFNRRAKLTTHHDFKIREEIKSKSLQELADLTIEEFDELFKGTPVRRTKHEGFQRNLTIVLNNTKKNPLPEKKERDL